ncbi:MAG TPA: hypothetical protein PKD53_21695, partial [Chloroflexaceae bacterium]|nr:hypothetical protein [Chloroflexaceae bacterium]
MPRNHRPLRALLPLAAAALLAATAPLAAAPQGRADAGQAAAAPTDRLIVTLRPTAGTAAQRADRPAEVEARLSAEAGADLDYVRP